MNINISMPQFVTYYGMEEHSALYFSLFFKLIDKKNTNKHIILGKWHYTKPDSQTESYSVCLIYLRI